MKVSMRIPLLVVAAAAALLLFSCADKPVSIEDRIADFFTSLNGDRSDTYTNLDPSTAAYSLTKPASFWDTPFAVATKPYSYTPNPPSTSTPSDVQITVVDSSGPTTLYRFVMVNIGKASDNWVINDIQTPPGSLNTILH